MKIQSVIRNIFTKYNKNLRTVSAVKISQYGRSMIEMLGVLAIMGVLSVGGIAGYSKVMHQIKLNKQAEQISRLLNVGIIYGYPLQSAEKGKSISMVPALIAMNEVPEEMLQDNSNEFLYDAFGTRLNMKTTWETNLGFPYQQITMTLSENSLDGCKNILNIAKMHSKSIWLIRHHGGRDIWGDKYCYTGRSCLKTILLHEIDDYCRVYSTTACHFMLAWR